MYGGNLDHFVSKNIFGARIFGEIHQIRYQSWVAGLVGVGRGLTGQNSDSIRDLVREHGAFPGHVDVFPEQFRVYLEGL